MCHWLLKFYCQTIFLNLLLESRLPCHAVLHNVLSLQKQVLYKPLGPLCKGKEVGWTLLNLFLLHRVCIPKDGPLLCLGGCYLNHKMIQPKAMELQKHFLPSTYYKMCVRVCDKQHTVISIRLLITCYIASYKGQLFLKAALKNGFVVLRAKCGSTGTSDFLLPPLPVPSHACLANFKRQSFLDGLSDIS